MDERDDRRHVLMLTHQELTIVYGALLEAQQAERYSDVPSTPQSVEAMERLVTRVRALGAGVLHG